MLPRLTKAPDDTDNILIKLQVTYAGAYTGERQRGGDDSKGFENFAPAAFREAAQNESGEHGDPAHSASQNLCWLYFVST